MPETRAPSYAPIIRFDRPPIFDSSTAFSKVQEQRSVALAKPNHFTEHIRLSRLMSLVDLYLFTPG